MDPLSISVGALAIVGAAQDAGKSSLKFLKTLKNAPRELQELIDEVTQIEAVLDDVKSAVEVGRRSTRALDLLLERAKAKLLELDHLINYVLIKAKEDVQVERLAWATHQKQIGRLQGQLRDVRHDLTLGLSAGAFLQSSQTRVELQQLTVASQRPPQDQQPLSAMLLYNQSLIEGMCQRIEDSCATQERLRDLVGNFRTTTLSAQGESTSISIPSTYTDLDILPSISQPMEFSGTSSRWRELRIRALKFTGERCPRFCPCRCHRPKRFTSFHFAKELTGHLSLTYSGISRLMPACSLSNCRRSLSTFVRLDYILPIWLADTMIAKWLTSGPLRGPEMLLKICRVVSTPAYYFAEEGEIEKLRNLFLRGRASALDLNPTEGQSALTKALIRRQWDTVQFLLNSGGDLDLEADFAGRTPKDTFLNLWLLHDRTTQMNLMPSWLLRHFDLEELLYERNLTSIHRIVLGLTGRDLKAEILEHPELVDIPDASGRTALFWASHSGQFSFARVLLSFNANPNQGDAENVTPLHAAAWNGSARIVELLLERGADVNAKNFLGETPLHFCCDGDIDANITQLLLDRGADCDPQDHQGWSPLIHCVLNDSNLLAELLLQSGSNLNVITNNGRYIWQYAVFHGATRVLRVLARHGCRFQPKTSSTSVLHAAALYGNCSVAQVLGELNLGHIDVDAGTEDEYIPIRLLQWRYRHCRNYPESFRPCSQDAYEAMEDLIARVRAANRRARGIADSGGDGDGERLSRKWAGRDNSELGADDIYSESEDESEESKCESEYASQDDDEALSEDAREAFTDE